MVDDLKMAVILELLVRAASVGQYLQGWDNLLDWMQAWYTESGGPNHEDWFDRQVLFMEQYILPLARRLGDSGALGETHRSLLVRSLEWNRDQWLLDGIDVIAAFREQTKKIEPVS